MRFNFSVQGDPLAMMEDEIRRAEFAVTRGVRKAGEGLKANWRGQVKSAGLGNRLANTIRAINYPKAGESIGAASYVYTKEPVVIDAHDRGALIRSSRGFWLAIPIGPAKGMRGPRVTVGEGMNARKTSRITPGGFEQRTGLRLRFVYRPGKPSLLVAEGRVTTKGRAVKSRSKTARGLQSIPVFLLVPQVKLRARMNLDRAAEAWSSSLPGLILENWRDRRA